MTETLGQLGEKEIHKRLSLFMETGQIDDDTAELDTGNKKILINNDLLVENVHFSECTTSPEDIGWRAVIANLSDVACSGSHEIAGITIGLVLTPQTTWEWLEGVYKGINAALKTYGGKILGGDCSKGDQKVISITAIGKLGDLRLHRSNALPGDCLVVSGPHGLSRLGLWLLQSERKDSIKIPEDLKKIAIRCHQRPEPPIEALKTLLRCKPKATPLRAAGTDSSDGLLNAIENICLSSNCSAIIEKQSLPKASQWPNGAQWDEWCLNGGEDFELVLSLPKEWANSFIKEHCSSYLIGQIISGDPIVYWTNGEKITNRESSRFEHFKT